MPWIQLRINSSAEHAEAVSDAMMECDAASVTFLDAHDAPIYEPLPGETRLWGETIVMGLWDASADMDAIVHALHQQLGEFSHKWEALEDKDWERAWMENFHPMKFGKRLWICPSWREAPEPDAVNVLLDPGLAFGTGTHPTTALCLGWLDSLELKDKTVIDYGCGSGILAVAALKLGARSAIGIDIDPQAIDASRENARRNHVEQRLTLFLADQQPQDLQADVLIANILAGPLKSLAPALAQLTRAGGQLALSGLLIEQAEDVCAAYRPWFEQLQTVEQEQWLRISGIRKAT